MKGGEHRDGAIRSRSQMGMEKVRLSGVRKSCPIKRIICYVGFVYDCKKVFAALTFFMAFGFWARSATIFAVERKTDSKEKCRAGETSGLRTNGLPDPHKINIASP
jgi:hypothetical protein